MKTVSLVLTILTIAAVPAFAEKPIWLVMAERYHAGELEGQPPPESTRVPDGFTSSAAKQFTVTGTADQTWQISPTPFAVDQGDMVTLKIRANSSVVHGFFLQRYSEGFTEVTQQEKTVIFFADTPGTFFFFCTVPSCGPGHATMGGTFVVNAVQSSLTVTGISPTSGSTSGGTSVTITGTNFVNGATVRFGNQQSPAVTFMSSTMLMATTPSQPEGNVSVTVTNPDNSSATAPGSFMYVFTGPAIASVNPGSGSTAGGTAITISGSGFQSGASVFIGSAQASDVVVVNSSTITAKTPLGPFDISASASRDVRVINPDGTAAIATSAFSYTLPSPTIASITPATSTTAGGTTVTITGTGFTTGLPTTISFGGSPGTNVQVLSAVTVSVVAPPHAAGTVDVVVRVGTGSVTAPGGFRYEGSSVSRRRAVRH